MFKLADIAYKFENDLNNAAEEAGYEWKFHVWTSAGYWDKPEREDNTVTHTITGELKSVGSAVEANAVLNMGVNTLSLTFLVPTFPPRSSEEQTAKELLEGQEVDVADGDGNEYAVKQIAFLNTVESLLSNYFTPARSETWTDDETTYSVGIRGGVAIPQMIDLASPIHSFVPINIYIELTFVEGGTNSLNVEVYMDGVRLPLQSFRPERSSAIASDVTNGDLISKTIATSSAFATQFTFPSNSDDLTNTVLDFLLNGSINKAHFLKVVWGEVEKLYLVVLTKATGGAEGTTNASFTVEITEAADDIQLLSFPDTYGVKSYEISASTISGAILVFNDTLTEDEEYSFYVGGNVFTYTANGDEDNVSLSFSEKDLIYNEDDGTYYLYVVSYPNAEAEEILSFIAEPSSLTFIGYVGMSSATQTIELKYGEDYEIDSSSLNSNYTATLDGNIITVTCDYSLASTTVSSLVVTSSGGSLSIPIYSMIYNASVSESSITFVGYVGKSDETETITISGGSGNYSINNDMSEIEVEKTGSVLTITPKYDETAEEEGTITITDTISGQVITISVSYVCYKSLFVSGDLNLGNVYVGKKTEPITVSGGSGWYTASTDISDDILVYITSDNTLSVQNRTEGEGNGTVTIKDTKSGEVLEIPITYYCYAALEISDDEIEFSGHVDDDEEQITITIQGKTDNYTISKTSSYVFEYVGYEITDVTGSSTMKRITFTATYSTVYEGTAYLTLTDNDSGQVVTITITYSCLEDSGDMVLYAAMEGHCTGYDDDGEEIVVYGSYDQETTLYLGYCVFYGADGKVFIMGDGEFYYNGLTLTLGDDGKFYDSDGNALVFGAGTYYDADGNELTLGTDGVLYDADGNELTFISRTYYDEDGNSGTANMVFDIDTEVVVATEDSDGSAELSMDTAPNYLVLGITGGDGNYTASSQKRGNTTYTYYSTSNVAEIFKCYDSYFLYVSRDSLSNNTVYCVTVSDSSGRSVSVYIQTYESV